MYLSRVEIDTNNRYKIRDLDHVGAYHNWVEQSFPSEWDQDIRTRKLWRIDNLHGKNYLLVLSSTEPDLKKLEQYGVSGSAESKDYALFINQLYNGLAGDFRVVLNPVVSKKAESLTRGRVMPYLSNEQQIKFLEDRSEKNGFKLNYVKIVKRELVPFKKHQQKTINLSKVTYEGNLTITDIDKFKNVLLNGFGKKKAYGFGLLTIIPEG
ncbi:type I-E CRISPR-associated protein Cas6/Cse3/CasE [Tuanshanicoccus lijuaniae]|uniref:type I-E CRISPR-associated protein Cas6/Cse3/CasE n=1 Tax=Aerococcaceae bacterium zg-1292 TaxID=2774330 RepID=UPI0019356955|nr:type I-E CRISPR-associated protein Cas6/Cse3/CasE [Aerococcaceae bacterium zg-1292]QQA36598.1 type I-E CRISPR-associated protein Cas6/Cse3/CasE [Aerococcaceae bacterium zg-1292]